MTRAGLAGSRLVGDVGGTNTRLALFHPDTRALTHLQRYKNSAFNSLQEVIEQWLQALPEPAPRAACLAVAAPPCGDDVALLNVDWQFSKSALQAQFAFAQLRCINDFEGNAYALPHLLPGDYTALRGAIDLAKPQKLATIGPGTGLGGATLSHEPLEGATPVVSASEPGHMGLAPSTSLEYALFQMLQPSGGEVFAERLVSGPGLLTLYTTLASLHGERAVLDTPIAVTTAAQAQRDPLACEALEVFCALLGSICGDYVLATGSYGGLYIAGGIAPQLLSTLRHSQFMTRFSSKGAMQQQLDAVPIRVVTTPVQGLIGAAHAPL